MIRAVHKLDESHSGYLTDYMAGLPDSVTRHSYQAASRCIVVLEIWPDEASFAEYWATGYRSSEHLRFIAHTAQTEIYLFTPFTRRGWTWMPASRSGPAHIHWENSAAVRVLYQYALPVGVAAFDPINTDETLREPGCEQFEYFADVGGDGHHVLLELWSNQYTYDVHWRLRQVSGESSEAPQMTCMPAGAPVSDDVIEFYRHRPMRCLYGVWGPMEDYHASHTIDWGSQ